LARTGGAARKVNIPCTSVAFSFIASEVKKSEARLPAVKEQVYRIIQEHPALRFFLPSTCKLVMFIDIILRQLVILLGMSYNFWTVFLALGFVARVVY
jgi:hypothetical protein